MDKFVSGYHKMLREIMPEIHQASSRSHKNRYKLGNEVLVNWQNGRVLELFIGDQGVRYFDPETEEPILQVIQPPKWPPFSVVDVSALFERRMRQRLSFPMFDSGPEFAKLVLQWSFNQIINGDVNASDVHSDL